MSENKHLTLDERNIIEQELTKNTSFKDITNLLSKYPTTISKEVRKHRIRKDGEAIHVNFNRCAKNIIAIDISFATLVVPKNVDTVIIVIFLTTAFLLDLLIYLEKLE